MKQPQDMAHGTLSSSEHLPVEFSAGEVILEAGDRSNALYLLEEGQIEVVKDEEVLGIIKDPRTFFGEMSFLMKNKRTATLRAKTKVLAYRVDSCSDEGFEGRLASASISFMKVMATRLDIVQREIKRLEPYRDFVDALKELSLKNKELAELFAMVESEVEIKEQSQRDNLLSRYLKTPWIWNRLERAIFDILKHYLQEELQVHGVEAWKSEPLLGTASALPFSGDRDGVLILELDPKLSLALQEAMGLEEGLYHQETTEEFNNLILGQLKRLVTDRAIQLETPCALSSSEELKLTLGGDPALKIKVSCSKGEMRLIYQLKL